MPTQAKPSWLVTWNMPGYLPESEPIEFSVWEEAREFLLSEFSTIDESHGDPEEEALEARGCYVEVAALPVDTEWSGEVGTYTYSLSECIK
jgi:hypothetical protein